MKMKIKSLSGKYATQGSRIVTVELYGSMTADQFNKIRESFVEKADVGFSIEEDSTTTTLKFEGEDNAS